MNRSKIVDRIRKLLELAKSPSKPEAASAKRMADALKKRHKITAKEIKTADPYARVEAEPAGSDPYWRERLLEAVAGRHRCVALRKDGRLLFEGSTADKAARMHRGLAIRIIAECQRTWNTSAGGVEGSLYLVWSTTFKAEAVRAIAERLAGTPAAPPATTPIEGAAASTKIVPAAKAQLAKASSEAEALVRDLAASVGEWMASILAADLVRKAAEAGRQFVLAIHLGDEPLLAGAVRKPRRSTPTKAIPYRSAHFKSMAVPW